MLRKAAKYTRNIDDLKDIYKTYIRSILEQSAVIWNEGLTNENKLGLERVQTNVFWVILKEDYKSYDHALEILKIDDLSTRQKTLLKEFAIGCITNEKGKSYSLWKRKLTIRRKEKFKNSKLQKQKQKEWRNQQYLLYRSY